MPGIIAERLIFSLGVTVTAMTIVFGMLLALMLIIKLQSFIINGSSKKKVVANDVMETKVDVLPKSSQEEEIVDLNNDCELVAAIMAALSAHTGKSVGQLNVRSIKRVSNNSSWRDTSVK